MNKLIRMIVGSKILQMIMVTLVLALYAGVLGLSLTPSVALILRTVRLLNRPGGVLLFGLSLGGALYLYFVTGIVLIGALVRLLTIGIKPGRYPRQSLTFLRWMAYSGLHNLAKRTILPMVSGTFLVEFFYRLLGCRIGKNVQLFTWIINDPYLLELEDNVVVGGLTDLSCHLFEGDALILDRVRVGANTLIGAHCYISPGVTIGRNCVIGLNVYLRKNKHVPDNSIITSLGGLPIKEMAALKKNSSLVNHRSVTP